METSGVFILFFVLASSIFVGCLRLFLRPFYDFLLEYIHIRTVNKVRVVGGRDVAGSGAYRVWNENIIRFDMRIPMNENRVRCDMRIPIIELDPIL